MPKIAVNFDSVPDQILPIDPGIYPLEVISVEEESVASKKKPGEMYNQVVVKLQVRDDGNKNDGRTVYDRIGIDNDWGRVALKRLVKSCGLTPGPDGLELNDLVGKLCRARIANRTYKDDSTGETKEASNIKEYLF